MHKPLFPWPGGKTRLLKHLLPLLSEKPHRTYVEPFAGGAAVLFNRSPAKVEVINDMHRELITLYRVVTHHLDEFVRQFRWILSSREEFSRFKATSPDALTDIQRAVRFFYLQKLTFGGKVHGQTFGTSATSPKRINLLRLEEDLSAAHLRLAGCVIECLPWDTCIARYDRSETLFFLDPPYWQTEGYGCEFPWTEYERLADIMVSLNGHAVLTINDHPDIRRVFGQFPSKIVDITYTIGGGKGVKRKELIYTTWEPKT